MFIDRNKNGLIRKNSFNEHGQQFSTVCHLVVRQHMSNFS